MTTMPLRKYSGERASYENASPFTEATNKNGQETNMNLFHEILVFHHFS
jgi:hypothetical protein